MKKNKKKKEEEGTQLTNLDKDGTTIEEQKINEEKEYISSKGEHLISLFLYFIYLQHKGIYWLMIL